MKEDTPAITTGTLCRLFGKSRHAYYDHKWRQKDNTVRDDVILQLVQNIRKTLPRLGGRKLLFMLTEDFKSHGINIGRDYFFDLLEQHKLLIRQRKRKVYTTNSKHWMRKYANLTGTLIIKRPEQLWVSDMTFIRIMNNWGYLSLITDAYSRKIVGYCMRSDMSAQGTVEALQMAINGRVYPHYDLMHHCDRGSQYCCRDYVNLLQNNRVAISMTEHGNPYENALAERMNGILKAEFNLYNSSDSFDNTYAYIIKSIKAYNEIRPHGSCDYLTPQQAHLKTGPLNKKWQKQNIAPGLTASFEEMGGAPLAKDQSLHYGKSNTSLGLKYEQV
jgi:putative transposase